MPQRYGVLAIAGALLLVHAEPAWTQQRVGGAYAEPVPPAGSGHARTADRCGPAPSGPGADEVGAGDPIAPLPNAYMTVNGRIFTLSKAVACAARLHTARIN